MTGQNPVKIKICGLTRPEDCQAVNQAGADYAGFVFAPSRRQVTAAQAQDLICSLNPDIQPVGVFVDETDERICAIASQSGLRIIQLHGTAMPDRIGRLRRLLPPGTTIWQQLPIALDQPSEAALMKACQTVNGFQSLPDAWLLDSCLPGRAGGTGQTFDWIVFRDFVHDHPTILAGGLNEDNIQLALNLLQPIAVDCSSGVETGGVKDPDKIKRFCKLVHETTNRRNDHD